MLHPSCKTATTVRSYNYTPTTLSILPNSPSRYLALLGAVISTQARIFPHLNFYVPSERNCRIPYSVEGVSGQFPLCLKPLQPKFCRTKVTMNQNEVKETEEGPVLARWLTRFRFRSTRLGRTHWKYSIWPAPSRTLSRPSTGSLQKSFPPS